MTTGADGVAQHLDVTWLTGAPPWLALFQRVAPGGCREDPRANAMVVGTVGTADGVPATRTVLCKGAATRYHVLHPAAGR